jgi:hypothetical protein
MVDEVKHVFSLMSDVSIAHLTRMKIVRNNYKLIQRPFHIPHEYFAILVYDLLVAFKTTFLLRFYSNPVLPGLASSLPLFLYS